MWASLTRRCFSASTAACRTTRRSSRHSRTSTKHSVGGSQRRTGWCRAEIKPHFAALREDPVFGPEFEAIIERINADVARMRQRASRSATSGYSNVASTTF